MQYKYIKAPASISFNELEGNDYCFAPSKYTRFQPNASVTYKTLFNLTKESIKKLKIKVSSEHNYTEIGDIDVADGYVYSNFFRGVGMPCSTPKEVRQNDILISTVRTYRGGVGLVCEQLANQCCSPAILILRDVDDSITKEYLFAVLRTKFFTEQILGFQNRGMYPRLDKEAMKHILIPIPKTKKEIAYISLLVRAYLAKVSLIKARHSAILKMVETELTENQKANNFVFKLPSINEIEKVGRLDTNLYRKSFQQVEFLIKNYASSYETISKLGFTLSRGQNLQISNIGESVYSSEMHPKFYSLMLPKFLSKYGTVDKIEYLGNPNKLKTLRQGDLIFGAEGFEKGRSIVIIEEKDRTITNIHGITIQQKESNVTKAIFVKCCLDYLRNKGLIDLYAVGGNGGSLAQKYWDVIPFPKFPVKKQIEIAELYHSPDTEYRLETFSQENFLVKDAEFNAIAGIHELDKAAKKLKAILDRAVDEIANGSHVSMVFKP